MRWQVCNIHLTLVNFYQVLWLLQLFETEMLSSYNFYFILYIEYNLMNVQICRFKTSTCLNKWISVNTF